MKPFWYGLFAVCMAYSIGFFFGVNYGTKVVPVKAEKTEFKIDPYTIRISELCTSFELWKKNNGL